MAADCLRSSQPGVSGSILADSDTGEPPRQPEKRLMFAVLQEAVRGLDQDILGGTSRTAKFRSEIEEWFAANDRRWPFSFVNICEALDLDASRLRRALSRWRENRQATATRSANPGSRTRSVWAGGREVGLFRWWL